MSKDTCIKANTYCPVHKGIVGADCWHDSKDFSVPRTDWKQVDEINTLREQVEKLTEECVVLRASNRTKLDTIAYLEKQVEKLTKERDDLRSRRCEVCGYLEHEREHTGCLREQLAALAEQSDLVRAEENEAIIAAANALENIASTSSSTRIRRVANEALTAIRARRK